MSFYAAATQKMSQLGIKKHFLSYLISYRSVIVHYIDVDLKCLTLCGGSWWAERRGRAERAETRPPAAPPPSHRRRDADWTHTPGNGRTACLYPGSSTRVSLEAEHRAGDTQIITLGQVLLLFWGHLHVSCYFWPWCCFIHFVLICISLKSQSDLRRNSGYRHMRHRLVPKKETHVDLEDN